MQPIIYQDIFQDVIADFESFYESDYNFQVKHEFNDDIKSRLHASVYGSGDKACLRFSTDCCQCEVTNLTELFVCMIVISHELAHYVNHHNYHVSVDNEDRRLIEAWADFFGMKIFMTLLTYGERVQARCTFFNMPEASESGIDCIGSAFDVMVRRFFNNDSKQYHYRIERLMQICCGVIAFFDEYFDNTDLERNIMLLRRLHNSAGMMSLADADLPDFDLSDDDFGKWLSIHNPLRDGIAPITPGLKETYRKHIDTTFALSAENAAFEEVVMLAKAITEAQDADIPIEVRICLAIALKKASEKLHNIVNGRMDVTDSENE